MRNLSFGSVPKYAAAGCTAQCKAIILFAAAEVAGLTVPARKRVIDKQCAVGQCEILAAPQFGGINLAVVFIEQGHAQRIIFLRQAQFEAFSLAAMCMSW